MTGEIVITTAELEREAELEIERRFKALGVERKPRPVRLGKGLSGKARDAADEFSREWAKK